MPSQRSHSSLGGAQLLSSHRSAGTPKTLAQAKAEGLLSSRRHTFNRPSSTQLTPLRASQQGWSKDPNKCTPGNGPRRPRNDVMMFESCDPVTRTHHTNGLKTMDLKPIGAFGGAGKATFKGWMTGADRTCNALAAQPV